jgi:hypothetical protein
MKAVSINYSTIALASSVLTAQGRYSLKAPAHFAALDPESATRAIDIDQAPPQGEGAAARRGARQQKASAECQG